MKFGRSQQKIRWRNLTTRDKTITIVAALIAVSVIGSTARSIADSQTQQSALPSTSEVIVEPVNETKTETKTEAIPYEVREIETAALERGVRTTTTHGINGVKTLTYDVTYTDGIEVRRDVIKEEITRQPVTEIISVGTYQQAGAASSCHPSYSGCVPNTGGDLDCGDIRRSVQVIGYDEYRLDGDNDGWGCESYS